jgi:hypothetical protein
LIIAATRPVLHVPDYVKRIGLSLLAAGVAVGQGAGRGIDRFGRVDFVAAR